MSFDPIEREDGKVFLKYDEIQIREKSAGLIEVVFHLQGHFVYRTEIDCHLSQGQVLFLRGLSGRMEVSFDR